MVVSHCKSYFELVDIGKVLKIGEVLNIGVLNIGKLLNLQLGNIELKTLSELVIIKLCSVNLGVYHHTENHKVNFHLQM